MDGNNRSHSHIVLIGQRYPQSVSVSVQVQSMIGHVLRSVFRQLPCLKHKHTLNHFGGEARSPAGTSPDSQN